MPVAPGGASSPAPIDLATIIKAYDVRGLSPEQLDTTVAHALGAAAAEVFGVSATASGADARADAAAGPPDGQRPAGPGRPRVVIGHDMRPTSPELVAAFARGVTDRGADVLVIGLCSTDGLYFASGSLDAPGAMFTASHNPAAYNGIKLCRAGAKPVGTDTGLDDVRALAQAYLDPAGDGVPTAPTPGTRTDRDLLGEYAAHLRSLVDLSANRPLKVVVDAGNGMAGLTVPAVLGGAAEAGGTPETDGAATPSTGSELSSVGLPALPLDVVPLYFELDGTFPNHEANPLEPENLRDLCKAVVEHGADIGLAFDGDADRCFVVDERGEPVSPSAVTALVALREVARARAGGEDRPVVLHNLITSRAVPEQVGAAGAQVVRTRVGHSYIKAEMARTGAVFGGEHSAHYYFRDFWGADTGMLAAMHVLAALGEQDGPLSELVAAYDPYAASGEINSRVDDVAGATDAVRATWEARGAGVDTLDGLTLSSPSGESPAWWFNLRPSNTEPLLRLNVEGDDTQTMARVRDEVLAQVRGVAVSPAAPWREPWLRSLLRCPVDGAELADATLPGVASHGLPADAASSSGVPALACTDPGHPVAFPVVDGVPVLLADDAVPVPDPGLTPAATLGDDTVIDEQVLDDPEALADGDPSGVLRALAGAGAQVRRAVDASADAGLHRLDPSERPRTVLVAARGGARTVADVVAALAGPASAVPVIARTGDVLPGWVGPLDLVVAVSLSGSKSPGVALVAEAGRRGARIITVGAADSSLARVSRQVRGLHVPTPTPGRDAVTTPTTRTALWSMLTPVLIAADRLGLLSATPESLAGLADVLDAEAGVSRPSSDTFVNPAKTLAVELDGAVPVVLGDGPVAAVAAVRAATVLARTARVPAMSGTLPDDAGDVVATFGGPFSASTDDEVFADPFLDAPVGPRLRLLLLREAAVSGSSDAVVALAGRSGVRVSEVLAQAPDDLGRLGFLVARTDFMAAYLALGSGMDPAISPHVADLRDATG